METEKIQRGHPEDLPSEDIKKMIDEDFADWLQQKVDSQFTEHHKFFCRM